MLPPPGVEGSSSPSRLRCRRRPRRRVRGRGPSAPRGARVDGLGGTALGAVLAPMLQGNADFWSFVRADRKHPYQHPYGIAPCAPCCPMRVRRVRLARLTRISRASGMRYHPFTKAPIRAQFEPISAPLASASTLISTLMRWHWSRRPTQMRDEGAHLWGRTPLPVLHVVAGLAVRFLGHITRSHTACDPMRFTVWPRPLCGGNERLERAHSTQCGKRGQVRRTLGLARVSRMRPGRCFRIAGLTYPQRSPVRRPANRTRQLPSMAFVTLLTSLRTGSGSAPICRCRCSLSSANSALGSWDSIGGSDAATVPRFRTGTKGLPNRRAAGSRVGWHPSHSKASLPHDSACAKAVRRLSRRRGPYPGHRPVLDMAAPISERSSRRRG